MNYDKLYDAKTSLLYKDKVEVDFYVPEDKLAIQVSYSITQSADTFAREVDALKRLPKVLPCERRLILTNEEENVITDEFGDGYFNSMDTFSQAYEY